MTYHFAVDLGATSGRTILASFDGEKVDMQEVCDQFITGFGELL